MALTQIPSCDDEVVCSALPQQDSGEFVVVQDPATKCQRALTGRGLPVQTSLGVALQDGSEEFPLKLPFLDRLESNATFPSVMVMNAGGKLFRLDPNSADSALFLASVNGRFELRQVQPVVCWNAGDICEDGTGGCEAGYIAGLRLVNGRLCLVKIPTEEFAGGNVDSWNDTTSVDISGLGLPGNKYTAAVKISAVANNRIQQKSDGIWADIPISAQSGNRLQRLGDGYFVAPEFDEST